MLGRSLLSILLGTQLVACGGGKTAPAGGAGGGDPIGDSHTTPPPDDDDPAALAAAPDAGVAAAPEPPKPPATLVFKNDAKQELTFAIDKGWGTTVFAYSGKPPKAKTALLFPRDCTNTCEATEDMCPICKEAEDPKQRQQDEKAETKREIVAAGASFTMEWDGLVYAYEPAPKEARGRNKKCECWRKVAPEPETYTIKACGLRAAKKVGAPGKMQCVETTVALPLDGTGNEIVLAFP